MRRFSTSPLADRPLTFVLVKLASRCNIKCTYCYWFRDAMVYAKPAVLTPEAEDAFCHRLEEHIREFELPIISSGVSRRRAAVVSQAPVRRIS